MDYPEAKARAIDIVDDFSKEDIVLNYGDAFDAKTDLDSIGLSEPVRAVMPPRTNKEMGRENPSWSNVGSIDIIKCATIGDFIKLCCKKSRIAVPQGEPK